MPFPEFIAPLTPVNVPVRRCPVPREDASERILIMGLGALGDVVAQSPLLAALRDAYPRSHLTWIVEHGNRGAVDASPLVDEVVSWDSGYWRHLLPTRWQKYLSLRRGLGLRGLWQAGRLRQELHRRRYDIYISLQPEEWAPLVRASGARVTVGVFPGITERDHTAATRRYGHSFLAPDLPEHSTNRALTPLTALGTPLPADKRLTMGYTQEDAEAVERLLGQDGAAGRSPVVLAPMTTWATKCWPAERYAALGDRLARKGGRIVLIGSGQEREAIEKVRSLMRESALALAGALTFRQMAALLDRAALVVSGDTGPMHVAAAVGTPYVALFGPTPPRRYAPLVGPGRVLSHAVPCGPCNKMQCANMGAEEMLCLRLITVEEAYQSANLLLGNRGANL